MVLEEVGLNGGLEDVVAAALGIARLKSLEKRGVLFVGRSKMSSSDEKCCAPKPRVLGIGALFMSIYPSSSGAHCCFFVQVGNELATFETSLTQGKLIVDSFTEVGIFRGLLLSFRGGNSLGGMTGETCEVQLVYASSMAANFFSGSYSPDALSFPPFLGPGSA